MFPAMFMPVGKFRPLRINICKMSIDRYVEKMTFFLVKMDNNQRKFE